MRRQEGVMVELNAKRSQKGQLFSLDFIIAIALTVLAMGMLLHFYEIAVYGEKEAQIQNEMNLIAFTASNVMLGTNECNLENAFEDQGYRLHGCSRTTNFASITKSELLVPDGFGCYITLDGAATTSDCTTNETSKDAVVLERAFLAQSGGSITKEDYEKCIAGFSCPGFTKSSLIVKVWKE